MSELGEAFAGWREHKKEKKADNKKSSTAILTEKGIQFESKNNGVHLIVKYNGYTADFWPSTGKYCIRGCRARRGVFNLIKELEK